MYTVLSSLKSFLKISRVSTDNMVFKLHYQLTSLLLVTFSVVVSTNQFFGKPITCVSPRSGLPDDLLDEYCWISSTYTLPGAHGSRPNGYEVPHPGVDKATPNTPKTYHQYYQWVVFFLFLQAIAFYGPRFFWKMAEGGRLEKMLLGLDALVAADDEEQEKNLARVRRLANYLHDSLNHNKCYTYAYFGCEMLNFVNVLLQMGLTDLFLGGEFSTYGSQVLRFANTDQLNRTDPMVAIFPKVAKCTFHKFGPTGSVQNDDALCVLPINVLNEKIFIFLWFYFIVLAIVSGLLLLLYRLPQFVFKKLRWRATSSRSHSGASRSGELQRIVIRCSLADWFLLHLLSKNVGTLNYRELIHELDRIMNEEDGPIGLAANGAHGRASCRAAPASAKIDSYRKTLMNHCSADKTHQTE